MRAYLHSKSRTGNEKWYWKKGVWEMCAIRPDGKGLETDIDQENFQYACKGIFGRLTRWDKNTFWTSLETCPLPPNFLCLPCDEGLQSAEGQGEGDMQTNEGEQRVAREGRRAPSLEANHETHTTREESDKTQNPWKRVQDFWRTWDTEAQCRTHLCSQRSIDWPAVEQSLRRSNHLLATSPDARLRRVARLAKLPVDTPIDTDQIVIYAILGPWSPYMGQLGAKEQPRPPIKRWSEHVSRAKALASKYMGQKHRKLHMFKGFGKTPSLGRVLAMHRLATGGMLLLQSATKENACQFENGWESALAPTTNQVAPRMDFANVLWENVINKFVKPGKCKSMAARVNSVLTASTNALSADELCHLVQVSKGYLNPAQFEKLWRLCAKQVRSEHEQEAGDPHAPPHGPPEA